jgi:hypothetical protein
MTDEGRSCEILAKLRPVLRILLLCQYARRDYFRCTIIAHPLMMWLKKLHSGAGSHCRVSHGFAELDDPSERSQSG